MINKEEIKVLKIMGKGDDIGREVADDAEQKSVGQCLKYVRRGIQRALGLPEQPIGIESAKDAGPWLTKVGFEKMNISDY